MQKKANRLVGLVSVILLYSSPSSQRAKRRMTIFSPMAATFWYQQLLDGHGLIADVGLAQQDSLHP